MTAVNQEHTGIQMIKYAIQIIHGGADAKSGHGYHELASPCSSAIALACLC